VSTHRRSFEDAHMCFARSHTVPQRAAIGPTHFQMPSPILPPSFFCRGPGEPLNGKVYYQSFELNGVDYVIGKWFSPRCWKSDLLVCVCLCVRMCVVESAACTTSFAWISDCNLSPAQAWSDAGTTFFFLMTEQGTACTCFLKKRLPQATTLEDWSPAIGMPRLQTRCALRCEG